LREAQKECDEVKQLYIEVCSSKEKLLATLESEQKAKRDLANLLDVGTEQLKKTQAELESERKKVRDPAQVSNILTCFQVQDVP
jgi:hypothetical protein